MKKRVFFISLTFSIFFIYLGFCSAFSGSGSGTPSDPYIITNCTQLQEIANAVSSHYKLGNDINCSNTINWNSGAGFSPINSFTGSLDGQNFVISYLYINRPSNSYQGLFGSTNSGALLKNLRLINISITGNSYTGGLVGYSTGSYIYNVSVSGNVSATGGNYVGGLVGYFQGYGEGRIYNSHSAGKVNGSYDYVGGLIGYSYWGSSIY